eukprot:1194120-Prorocentrum_minimum.AAC.11
MSNSNNLNNEYNRNNRNDNSEQRTVVTASRRYLGPLSASSLDQTTPRVTETDCNSNSVSFTSGGAPGEADVAVLVAVSQYHRREKPDRKLSSCLAPADPLLTPWGPPADHLLTPC